jgi:hypothetical protein
LHVFCCGSIMLAARRSKHSGSKSFLIEQHSAADESWAPTIGRPEILVSGRMYFSCSTNCHRLRPNLAAQITKRAMAPLRLRSFPPPPRRPGSRPTRHGPPGFIYMALRTGYRRRA